jgi:hypothetical protein
MPPEKLAKLNNLLSKIKKDSVSPKDIEGFLVVILETIKKSKNELETLSKENLQTIADSIAYIEKNHAEALSTLDDKSNAVLGQIEAKLALVDSTLKKVKKIKATPGKDAEPVDEQAIISSILAQIVLPEYKETILDDGEQIADKLEALTGDAKLDFSALKNVPQFKGGKSGGVVARNIYQMGDVSLTSLANNDTLKWDDTNKLWVNGTGGAVAWGAITGTLSNQTDLQTQLDLKANKSFAIAMAVAL